MLPSNLVTNAITTLKTNPPKSEVVLKHLSHTLVAILICPSIYPLITPATTYTCTLYVPEWTSPVHTQTLQNAFVRKLTWQSLGIEPETFKSQVQHNYHAISTQPPHPPPSLYLPHPADPTPPAQGRRSATGEIPAQCGCSLTPVRAVAPGRTGSCLSSGPLLLAKSATI